MSDIFKNYHYTIEIAEVSAVQRPDRRGSGGRYVPDEGTIYLKSGQTLDVPGDVAREVKRMKEARHDD